MIPTPTRLWRAVAVLAASLLTLVVVAGSAVSAESDGGPSGLPVVTGVDAIRSDVEISVLSSDYSVPADAVSVMETGGQQEGQDDDTDPLSAATVTSARLGNRATELVFVLDVDNRTSGDAVLDRVGEAIIAIAGDLPPEVEVAVVTAGSDADAVTRLTSSSDRVAQQIRAIEADRGAALFDGVSIAGEAMSDTPGAVRSVIVFSGGPDTASTVSAEDAAGSLVQSGAQLIAVNYGEAEEGLQTIVDTTGGTMIEMRDVDGARNAIEAATAVAVDRLLVSYRSDAALGQRRNVTLTIDETELNVSYPNGVVTSSAFQLAPDDDGAGSRLSFFGNSIVLYISILLAFIAITGTIWALASMFSGGQSALDSLLSRYAENDEALEEEEVQEMLIQSALVQRAVDLTESFVERRGFLARIEDLLERANLPVRAGEGIFFITTAMIVVTSVVYIVGRSVFFAGMAGMLTVGIGFFTVKFLASRRLKTFEAQLPDTLQLLAGTLRAGYSLPQGLDAVADEISDPMGHELRRAITEAQLGRELEEALTGISDRLNSPDFAWAVMAIGIQREVGGNLNELLMTVSETMIQRERLRREVNALTAEGRVSAAILSFMPPGLGFVLWVMNPDYVEILFASLLGWALIGGATISALVGLVWMKKVITIDA